MMESGKLFLLIIFLSTKAVEYSLVGLIIWTLLNKWVLAGRLLTLTVW
ncbi:hypothetical protein ES703_115398 [subsurface metagenome]